MNAPRPPFRNARNAAKLLAVGAAGLVLTGCIGNPLVDAKVDPASPVAADVARLTRTNRDYPRFSEIPAPPTDLRPVGLYGREAEAVKAAGARLIAETAPETWTLGDTQAFADRARRDAGPELEPATDRDSDAFARELRERATPPPPR